jgi:hypothetical protein
MISQMSETVAVTKTKSMSILSSFRTTNAIR